MINGKPENIMKVAEIHQSFSEEKSKELIVGSSQISVKQILLPFKKQDFVSN